MTDWWTVPYKGGKMVPVNGFPRPLYPPDANRYGKKPSAPGPDVDAYQRVVSRLGRWPWDDFTSDFTNDFAHGAGGNVGVTGVAGCQRQQRTIDDTGWVGEKTFNFFRSARCPPGPHEGEMAMDGVAVELINEAWAAFGGHEPPPAPAATKRQQALDLAITQIGVVEDPADSNVCPYSLWYGMIGPWCAMFTTWAYENVPGGSLSFARGQQYAYVPYIVADARANKFGLSTTDDPIPGDLVCYDWQCNGEYDHVGLFEAWVPGSTSQWTAIEGNTSTANDSNGGAVMRRQRERFAQNTVFVRVADTT